MVNRFKRRSFALVLSVLLHSWALGLLVLSPFGKVDNQNPLIPDVVMIEVPQPEKHEAVLNESLSEVNEQTPATKTQPDSSKRAYMAAPPAPTAEEWAQASNYKLKNSKRYRYTWGQQVRSMMGTAFEGPDQGSVRFEIEISPDGTLSRLETLWSTSPKAEGLARQAIASMPPLPPTPNGKPLVFQKTISFQPFETEVPPLYKDDCLPDPPAFTNPYAWDGKSPQGQAVQPTGEKLNPEKYEECLKQLPQDSIGAEAANDRRQIERWRSPHLGN